MSLTITHSKVSGQGPASDPSLVGGDDWDADHVVTGGAVQLVDFGVITAVSLLTGPNDLVDPGSGDVVVAAWITDSVVQDVAAGFWVHPSQLPHYTDVATATVKNAWAWTQNDGTVGGFPGGATISAYPSIMPLLGVGGRVTLQIGDSPVTGTWAAATAYSQFDAVAEAGHLWFTTDAGTSGGSEPDFPGNIGGSVGDNGMTWVDAGAVPTEGSIHVWMLVATPVTP